MRLLIDLQCVQSSSSARGIGRYALALTKALASDAGENSVEVLMNGGDDAARLMRARTALEQFMSPQQVHVFEAAWPWQHGFGPGYREAAEAAYAAAVRSLRPDVLLVGSVFESDGENVLGISPDLGVPTAAVLYDVIPAMQPGVYLLGPGAESYWRRFDHLRAVDLLLSISEHSAEQARTLLGQSAPPIVPIWGGPYPVGLISGATPAPLPGDAVPTPDRYLLAVGGDHPRKNLDRLVTAWALVPEAIRGRTGLVVSCRLSDGSLRRLRKKARRAGLRDGDLIFTGEVSDSRLDILYRDCDAFVFPSTEEGLGLPPLEAMSRGKPTLLARGSALSELMDVDDGYFDGWDVDDMAHIMSRVLTDYAFNRRLVAAASRSVERFSWTRVARFAWTAISDLAERGASVREAVGSDTDAKTPVVSRDAEALRCLPNAPQPVRVDEAVHLAQAASTFAWSELGIPYEALANQEPHGLCHGGPAGVRTTLAAATAVVASSDVVAEKLVAAGILSTPITVEESTPGRSSKWLAEAAAHDFYRSYGDALSGIMLTSTQRKDIVRAVVRPPRWMLERPWPVWLLLTRSALTADASTQIRAAARQAGGALAVGSEEAALFAESTDAVVVEGALVDVAFDQLHYARTRGTAVIVTTEQAAAPQATLPAWCAQISRPAIGSQQEWCRLFKAVANEYGRTTGWPWRAEM